MRSPNSLADHAPDMRIRVQPKVTVRDEATVLNKRMLTWLQNTGWVVRNTITQRRGADHRDLRRRAVTRKNYRAQNKNEEVQPSRSRRDKKRLTRKRTPTRHRTFTTLSSWQRSMHAEPQSALPATTPARWCSQALQTAFHTIWGGSTHQGPPTRDKHPNGCT